MMSDHWKSGLIWQNFADPDYDASDEAEEIHDNISEEDGSQFHGRTQIDEQSQRMVDDTLQSEVPVRGVIFEVQGAGKVDDNEAAVEQDQTASAPVPLTEGNPSANEASPPAVPGAPSLRQADNDSKLQSSPRPDYSVIRLIEKAEKSAGKLVNLLAKHFACFRDETRYDGRHVRFLKRAQIFVADLWAAFNGNGFGEFHDIDALTMFPGEHRQIAG